MPVWGARARVVRVCVVWVCPGYEYLHAMELALSVVVGTRIHPCNGTSTLSGSVGRVYACLRKNSIDSTL